jgi:hypothetical protein
MELVKVEQAVCPPGRFCPAVVNIGATFKITEMGTSIFSIFVMSKADCK